MKGRSPIFRHLLAGLAVITLTATLPATSPVALAQDSASSLFAPSQPRFLDVDEAFRYHINLNSSEQIAIHWQIAPGYYLYADKFAVTLSAANQADQAPELHIPPGKPHVDEYFGAVEVFYEHAVLTVDLPPALAGKNTTLLLNYQGCADAGLCYPPEQREIDIWHAPQDQKSEKNHN